MDYRDTYETPYLTIFIPMFIKKIRDGETVTIHSDKSKKIPGSRHYIHAEDASEAILFLLNKNIEFVLVLGTSLY